VKLSGMTMVVAAAVLVAMEAQAQKGVKEYASWVVPLEQPHVEYAFDAKLMLVVQYGAAADSGAYDGSLSFSLVDAKYKADGDKPVSEGLFALPALSGFPCLLSLCGKNALFSTQTAAPDGASTTTFTSVAFEKSGATKLGELSLPNAAAVRYDAKLNAGGAVVETHSWDSAAKTMRVEAQFLTTSLTSAKAAKGLAVEGADASISPVAEAKAPKAWVTRSATYESDWSKSSVAVKLYK